MSDTSSSNSSPITNPLQNNNMAMVAIGYIAATLANKFPFFTADIWNYIILSIGGIVTIAATGIVNRKSAVVATVANMPEVNRVELDKAAPGTAALSSATPNNVVMK